MRTDFFRKQRGKKKLWKILFLLLAIGLVSYGVWNFSSISPGKGLKKAVVERIVDGDTIVVFLSGQSQKVRMIGIDCPESVHPDNAKNTKAGKRASDYTKERLRRGSTVYLQKDVSDKDRYGRLLRYVWIRKPSDVNNKKEIREKMFNAILIKEGYAKPKKYKPDLRYADIFSKIQKERAHMLQSGARRWLE